MTFATAPVRGQPDPGEPLRVSVAASLEPLMQRVMAQLEPPIQMEINAAASGTLAMQIQRGSAVDLFISADPDWITHLQQQAKLLPGSAHAWLHNQLVVVRADQPASVDWKTWLLDGLLDGGEADKIAMGDPSYVPAGRYATAALEQVGIWHQVKPHLVYADNVRAVLTYVQQGYCQAGLVYASDAATAPTLFASRVEPAIAVRYAMAIPRSASSYEQAERLADWLRHDPEVKRIAQSMGFGSAPLSSTSVQSEAGVDIGAILQATALSLLCGLGAVILALPIGLPLAAWLARGGKRGRRIGELLVLLPLVLPPVVIGYVLLRALGFSPLIFTWPAAAMAQAVVALPLIVLTARVAMESIDPQMEQAARQMGASRWRVFWRVDLPLCKHAIAAGCLLGFARALGEFGATILVAGNIPGQTRTLPLAIYSALQTPGPSGEATATALSLIAIALAAGAVGLSRLVAMRALRFRF